MPSRGPGSQWKPRRNWNAKAPCANANSDNSARWTALAPPRKLKKTSPRKSRRRKKNNYAQRNRYTRVHRSAQRGEIPVALHDHSQQETHDREGRENEVQQ